jgi:AAA domain
VSAYLAACVSKGNGIPDDASGAVIVSCEDGLADTVRPRLEAAGADLTRVRLVQSVIDPVTGEERSLSLPQDIPLIECAIESVQAKLLVIDPLMGFLSEQTDSKTDHDVRRAIAPLARLAERTGVVVVVIRHLNKGSSSNPLYRGGGSIGIIAAARLAFLFAKDPENPHRTVIACSKSNLGAIPDSLAYEIKQAENGAAVCSWVEGTSKHTALSLLFSQMADDSDGPGALSGATKFLGEYLKGGAQLAKDVKHEARSAGFSEKTLRRARERLGVVAVKSSFTGGWSWGLPGRDEQHATDWDTPKLPNSDTKMPPDGTLGACEQQADSKPLDSHDYSKMPKAEAMGTFDQHLSELPGVPDVSETEVDL